MELEKREQKREIVEEMRESYLDYAMSVIVARALPDVRDGLKPVHRRILYAMHELGLTHQAKFRKSANVVGEVLGKYHPHGDTAVYDSLVRMAQDFSFRYPLVDGQGNFGCFTKDTKIKLADGRNLAFVDLIKEYQRGEKLFTYTINTLGLVSVAEIKNPRLTRKKADIIEVYLDNGEKITCTPNHLFMLKDGLYKEARALTPQDSLMPLYEKLSEKTDGFNREGYLLLYQPKKDEWVPAHHLADNYNLSHKKYRKNAGRVRHHIDFNKLNNNPDNIVRLEWEEHWKLHYKHASQQHADPEYRKKIATGRNTYWAQKENKDKHAALLSKRNSKNWKNAEYREKMRVLLSDVNKAYIQAHPERRKVLSEQATKTLKRLWQNPEYQMLMHEKIVKGNRNHTTNATGKLKFLNICREALDKHAALTEKYYEEARKEIYSYGAAPLWQTGLTKYFQGSVDLVRLEINQNHKIISVKKLQQREDVYDLTIDNTHNFALAAGIFVHNSIDGDTAAAMRYTECRMAKIAGRMLADIEKETVNFVPNYDGSKQEPVVLPAAVPQLLLNGSLGIAVGMATNIPPHNMIELANAIIHLVDHPKATTEDLMEFVKGPDFPTGGIIFNKKDIFQAFATGRGGIVTRGEAEIVENKQGNFQIIISSIPYQVNKSLLLEKIADLVQEKRIEGIKDMRDESDKEGLRIAIDLKSGAFPQKVLNSLYKHTDLERTFHVNTLALVDGIQPHILSLKSLLEEFIKHRNIVIERRTRYDLRKAEERAHILEGLKKALDHIDEVIKVIKSSKDREEAHGKLTAKFRLSGLQATAILEMRLQTLAGLERKKIEDELEEKRKLIAELKSILDNPKKILQIIKTETAELKKEFPEERRTRVVAGAAKTISTEDIVPEEEIAIIITKGGYIKRINPQEYRMQRRGGKGMIGMTTKEEDLVEHFVIANTHDNLLFFTSLGKVYQIKAYEIPEGKRMAKGKSIVNFLMLAADELVTSILPMPKGKAASETSLTMITHDGVVKKTEAKFFQDVRRSGIIAIKLQKGDSLGWVRPTEPGDELTITTRLGMAIRFKEKEVRNMGRTSAGVRGIRLKKDDNVVGADVIKKGASSEELLVVSRNGFGKKTKIKEYKTQGRGGSGIKTMNITSKTGQLISARILLPDEEELIAVSQKGQVIRTMLKDIPSLGRATQGVRIMKMDAGDHVASVTSL